MPRSEFDGGDIMLRDLVQWECPYDEYRAFDALGSTDLKGHLEDVPEIKPENAAFGNALHLAVLEPERFDEGVIVGPKCDGRLKTSRRAEGRLCPADYAAWCAEHEGKIVLTEEVIETVQACAKAVLEHPMAAGFFSHPKAVRESCLRGVYDDGLVRVPVKSRRDIALGNAVVDLKSAADASAGSYESKVVHAYGYDLQGALYADLHEALTGEPSRFALVVVDKNPPHRVGVYELGAEWRQLGRRRYVAACRLASVAKATTHARRWWEKPMTLVEPPSWAYRETQRVEEYAEEMARIAKEVTA